MRFKKYIENFYIKLKFKKNIYIRRFVNLDKNTFLEGGNIVNKNSNIAGARIGYGTYIGDKCNFSNCVIGKFTSIASNCSVIYGNHPSKKFVSTHPAFFSVRKQSGFTFVEKNIFDDYKYFDKQKKISVKIGNDVWIGESVKILEGIEIGDGAIIGAGSIVTKNVGSYEVVAGVPAKKIRKRFDDDYIDFLKNVKWWNNDIEWIERNSMYFSDIVLFKEKYGELI